MRTAPRSVAQLRPLPCCQSVSRLPTCGCWGIGIRAMPGLSFYFVVMHIQLSDGLKNGAADFGSRASQIHIRISSLLNLQP